MLQFNSIQGVRSVLCAKLIASAKDRTHTFTIPGKHTEIQRLALICWIFFGDLILCTFFCQKRLTLSCVTSFMNVPLPDLSISYKLNFIFLQRTPCHLKSGCNASLKVWRSGKLVCSCKYNCA